MSSDQPCAKYVPINFFEFPVAPWKMESVITFMMSHFSCAYITLHYIETIFLSRLKKSSLFFIEFRAKEAYLVLGLTGSRCIRPSPGKCYPMRVCLRDKPLPTHKFEPGIMDYWYYLFCHCMDFIVSILFLLWHI